MKKISYTITDAVGIHARPAGDLVRTAKGFQSSITLEKDGRTAPADGLLAVMSMGVKCGDTVNVIVEGTDEDKAAKSMEEFFKANL